MSSESKYTSRYFTYIQPVLRSRIVRTYGTTIFTLAAMCIFIFFAIKPTIETLLVLQKKLTQSQEVYQKITTKAENLTQARKNYQNLDTEIKTKIKSGVPNDVNFKTVVQTLEAVALLNQASISAIQIQPVTINPATDQAVKNKNVAEISFTVNLEGSYDNLLNFISQLRSANRVLAIETLSLNKNQDNSNLLLSINGKAYYIK